MSDMGPNEKGARNIGKLYGRQAEDFGYDAEYARQRQAIGDALTAMAKQADVTINPYDRRAFYEALQVESAILVGQYTDKSNSGFN